MYRNSGVGFKEEGNRFKTREDCKIDTDWTILEGKRARKDRKNSALLYLLWNENTSYYVTKGSPEVVLHLGP